jgi:hypothetical protein
LLSLKTQNKLKTSAVSAAMIDHGEGLAESEILLSLWVSSSIARVQNPDCIHGKLEVGMRSKSDQRPDIVPLTQISVLGPGRAKSKDTWLVAFSLSYLNANTAMGYNYQAIIEMACGCGSSQATQRGVRYQHSRSEEKGKIL